MEKHFKLTEETILNEAGVTLHRIMATRDSRHAKAGQTGGFIEKEENLGGEAWVTESAQVYGDALVDGRARISDHAQVYGKAHVGDSAMVTGYAQISGKASVTECATIGEEARIEGSAHVGGSAEVRGSCLVCDYASVREQAVLTTGAKILGSAVIEGQAEITGNAIVHGEGHWIYVDGNPYISWGAVIKESDDYLVYQREGASCSITAYRTKDDYRVAYLRGEYPLCEFIEEVKADFQDAPERLQEMLLLVEIIRLRFGESTYKSFKERLRKEVPA